MKYIYTFLLAAIINGCASSSDRSIFSVSLESDIGYDSLSLYQIDGTKAVRIGQFKQENTNKWSQDIPENNVAILKIYTYKDKERGSLVLIHANDNSIEIKESSGKLNVGGSYETGRLFKIVKLMEECDEVHFRYQKQLINYYNDPDSVSVYNRKALENQMTCYSSLKSIIRDDYSSLASLYALNYIDPAENLDLIDSVYCLTKKRYSEIYLHNEILSIHQLKVSNLSCP